MTTDGAKKTALYAKHRALGAKLVPFAGYVMPLQYSGQVAEHNAVREGLGLFDLSHMGEFRLRGAGALDAADRLVTNRVADTRPGQAVYSPMCREDGGIVDDLLVYHLEDSVFLVVNAANIEKDRAWVESHLPSGVSFEDESDATSLLAVQGPRAETFMKELTGHPVEALGYYTAAEAEVAGVRVLLSRTGYTGEDGFELYLPNSSAAELWDRLLEAGQGQGMIPVGLAARDTLRFEMGYCLYGSDIDETTTPLEAVLGWTVKLKKDDFIGKEALAAQKSAGLTRKLVGLEVTGGRAIPRAGCPILAGAHGEGAVTSGTFSPSLKKGMALGYVPIAAAKPGTPVDIDIRGRRVEAVVTRPPFYTHGSRKTG